MEALPFEEMRQLALVSDREDLELKRRVVHIGWLRQAHAKSGLRQVSLQLESFGLPKLLYIPELSKLHVPRVLKGHLMQLPEGECAQGLDNWKSLYWI